MCDLGRRRRLLGPKGGGYRGLLPSGVGRGDGPRTCHAGGKGAAGHTSTVESVTEYIISAL